MIEIKTEENKLQATAFLREHGDETDIENAIVMSAREKDAYLAVGALFLKEYKVCLDLVVPSAEHKENTGLILGLMKSLLNLADLRGIKTVYGLNPDLENLYKLLRFKEADAGGKKVYELSLEGYFTCEHE